MSTMFRAPIVVLWNHPCDSQSDQAFGFQHGFADSLRFGPTSQGCLFCGIRTPVIFGDLPVDKSADALHNCAITWGRNGDGMAVDHDLICRTESIMHGADHCRSDSNHFMAHVGQH